MNFKLAEALREKPAILAERYPVAENHHRRKVQRRNG
jgi:hypothetical protein